MRIAIPSTILFVFLFTFHCSYGNQHFSGSQLAGKWVFSGSTGVPVSANATLSYDTMLFAGDSLQNRFFLSGGKSAFSGSWKLISNTLLLFHDDKPLGDIDSVSAHGNDSAAQWILFHDSSMVAKGTADSILMEIRAEVLQIISLAGDTLRLKKDSLSLVYTRVSNREIVNNKPSFSPIQKKLSGFSWNSLWRGLLGIGILILILVAFSRNRRAVSWKLVVSGLLLQILFAVCVLHVPLVKTVFEVAGNFFVVILSFTKTGAEFVFGNLVHNTDSIGFVFAFQILPTILFFSALTSVLFYLGILQKIVYGIAWVMSRAMKMSGAESLSVAANIFIGQTEAPLLIKPYISNMTRSEILCIMIGGMATIAGGVMAAYIGFLGGDDPARQLFFAKHLLCASVMSAPAAVVAAKILLPQTQPIETKIRISQEKIGRNMLEAIANGTYDGLRLAVNVGAMLIVFIALVAMVNYFLKDIIGNYADLNKQITEVTNGRYDGLTLQFLLGLGCAPLSWLMGVSSEDMVLVGQLLGEKTILNEFVAYTTLGNMQFSGAFAEEKSIIIATYILCGFSNFSSIGIQIGGIGALAPDQKTTLSELGISALIGGTVASLFTATIVGIII